MVIRFDELKSTKLSIQTEALELGAVYGADRNRTISRMTRAL
jgi:hypothetical protein